MVSNKAISPPVANLLVTSLWPVSLVSAKCWLTVGRQLAICQWRGGVLHNYHIIRDFLYIKWLIIWHKMTLLSFLCNTLFCGTFIRGTISQLGMSIKTPILTISMNCHFGFWTSCKYMAWNASKQIRIPFSVTNQIFSCYILNKKTSING